MILLLAVTATPVVSLKRIPLNPTTVPVPPFSMLIEPTLLLEILAPLTKLFSKKPVTAEVLAVIDVSFTTIVDEPSKLPTVLPVMLNRPVTVPVEIPMNAEEALPVEARLDVWLIPEMVLF